MANTTNTTLKIGTFAWNDKEHKVICKTKEYAIPRNIADEDMFAVQFRYTYWNAEIDGLKRQYNAISDKIEALNDKWNNDKYDKTYDEFCEKLDEYETAQDHITDVKREYYKAVEKLIEKHGTENEDGIKMFTVHRFVTACVYTVNRNMRINDDGKTVYFGFNGKGITSVIGDMANGTKSYRDGKSELVDYLNNELFADGTNDFVRGANIRLTDEQIEELVNAYKGVIDIWGKKNISTKRCTKGDLNAQIILKCLKKTFKFSETATKSDTYI